MKLEPGMKALITGASRGLGVEIAKTLAAAGVNLVLTARSATDLARVADDIRTLTRRSVDVHPAEIADPHALDGLVAASGEVDVLVNNAGIEGACAYDARSRAEIAATIAVNLTAPMLLTHAILPGMLARGRGHVVNVASVAGFLAVPFNEPYSATKAGLIGFTRSLRLTARVRGWPVSASAVCPGFIDGAGMFETLKTEHEISIDGLGSTPLHRVGPAVIDAIENDLPDIFVSDPDPRAIAAMSVSDPAALEPAIAGSPMAAMFAQVAASRT